MRKVTWFAAGLGIGYILCQPVPESMSISFDWHAVRTMSGHFEKEKVEKLLALLKELPGQFVSANEAYRLAYQLGSTKSPRAHLPTDLGWTKEEISALEVTKGAVWYYIPFPRPHKNYTEPMETAKEAERDILPGVTFRESTLDKPDCMAVFHGALASITFKDRYAATKVIQAAYGTLAYNGWLDAGEFLETVGYDVTQLSYDIRNELVSLGWTRLTYLPSVLREEGWDGWHIDMPDPKKRKEQK